MRLWSLHPRYLDAKGLVALWREGLLAKATKLNPPLHTMRIRVTLGQIRYEWNHLLSKLFQRDPERSRSLCGAKKPMPHPMMEIVPGEIEPWEVAK